MLASSLDEKLRLLWAPMGWDGDTVSLDLGNWVSQATPLPGHREREKEREAAGLRPHLALQNWMLCPQDCRLPITVTATVTEAPESQERDRVR